MKLAFFDDFKLGVVKGDAIVDVSAVVKDIPACRPGRPDQRPDRRLRHLSRQAGGGGNRRRARRWQASASGRRCRSRATSSAWR